MFKQKPDDPKTMFYGLIGWIIIGLAVYAYFTRDAEQPESAQAAQTTATDAATKVDAATPAIVEPPKPPQPTPEEVAAKEKELLYGHNCMSPWNGSHPAFVDVVKKQLNDPSSFEHVNTTSWPRNDEGRSRIVMTFRAKNGFGGVISAKAVGTINGDDCQDANLETMSE